MNIFSNGIFHAYTANTAYNTTIYLFKSKKKIYKCRQIVQKCRQCWQILGKAKLWMAKKCRQAFSMPTCVGTKKPTPLAGIAFVGSVDTVNTKYVYLKIH